MNILGVCGSPRRGGNSELLLDAALKGARSASGRVRKLVLSGLDIEPCRNCGGCYDTGECVIRDDMRRVFKEFEGADAVIIASPVYFGSVSGQLKTAVDRFQPYWVKKYVLKEEAGRVKGRKGAFLSVSGGSRSEFFEGSATVIKTLFTTLDIEFKGRLFVGGVDRKAQIKKKVQALDKAFRIGKGLSGEL